MEEEKIINDDYSTYCDQCGKKFTNIYTLKAHKKSIHEQIKNFICQYCDNKFVTKYKLQRHIQGLHFDNRDFHCEECGGSFKTRDMLVKHSRTHSKGLGPFLCESCNLEFKFKSGLDHHYKLKHQKTKRSKTTDEKKAVFEFIKIPPKGRKPKDPIVEDDEDDNQVDGDDNIEIIEESFIVEEVIKDEIIYEEYEQLDEVEMVDVDVSKDDPNKYEEEETRIFICDSCGNSFKSKNHLKRHHARVHGDETNFKYSCEQCEKKFLLNYDLQRHMVMHDTTRSMECHQCGKKFKTKASLDSHVKVLHETDRENQSKNFICNVCNRSYLHRRHLEYHVRKHTNDRRYVCNKCSERFLYSDALKWHCIRIHDAPAPFICKICSRRFIHQKTYDSHLNEHDKNDGSLAVSCPICFKKISEKRHLKRHMRIHQEKSFICEQCNASFQEKYQLTRHVSTHESKSIIWQ